MNGLSLLRVLRGTPSTSEIAVIMLSSAEDRDDILQAAKLGIRGYVLKSHFSLKDLMTRVTQHFGSATPAVATTESSAIDSSPNVAAANSNSTITAPPRCSVPTKPGAIPSLMNREQCIARAKESLHGRTLSGVVAEVIAVAASPRGDASDLTSLIARDPLLSARVLQVANSTAYASARGVVSTLPEAVRNVGSRVVRNIAAGSGVFDAMPPSDSDGLNLVRCWQHAFAVATLCQRFASEGQSGLAYLVGLCHDLGEILFQGQFADEYRQVLELQQLTGKPRDEIETTVFGMTHGELLQTIVTCLELPTSISAPIQEYHSKGITSSAGSSLTRLLRVADLYSNGMLLASSNQSPLRPITSADTSAVTGQGGTPEVDRIAVRGEILGLSAALSRFSKGQQAEAMTAPYPRLPVRVWLARFVVVFPRSNRSCSRIACRPQNEKYAAQRWRGRRTSGNCRRGTQRVNGRLDLDRAEKGPHSPGR